MNGPEPFQAFANPTRLRILNLLQEEKELCVCDLCQVLPAALHRTLLRCVRSCSSELDELVEDRERLAGLELRTRCT